MVFGSNSLIFPHSLQNLQNYPPSGSTLKALFRAKSLIFRLSLQNLKNLDGEKVQIFIIFGDIVQNLNDWDSWPGFGS